MDLCNGGMIWACCVDRDTTEKPTEVAPIVHNASKSTTFLFSKVRFNVILIKLYVYFELDVQVGFQIVFSFEFGAVYELSSDLVSYLGSNCGFNLCTNLGLICVRVILIGVKTLI